jgi:hypothetical protein
MARVESGMKKVSLTIGRDIGFERSAGGGGR